MEQLRSDGGWVLQLMGRAELHDDLGAAVRLSTRKVLHLLAILAMDTERGWRREELARLVWPEAAECRARASLRTALNALRQGLPPGTLLSRADSLSLAPGCICCDAAHLRDHTGYLGEFMPGFDGDWVIDERLRLQDLACESALKEAQAAWGNNDREAARALAERACRIDPLNEEAIALRASYLDQTGRIGAAATVLDVYRGHVRRELQELDELRPAKRSTEIHPLLQAAEWLLERNPDEALGMLASTQNQWLSIPLGPAIDIHRRILAAAKAEAPGRSLAEAHYLFMLSLGASAEITINLAPGAYARAVSTGDNLAAARLAAALAFAQTAIGDFARGLKMARIHAHISERLNSVSARERAAYNLGTIELHVGEFERGYARLAAGLRRCEELGDAEGASVHKLSISAGLLHQGRQDEAQAMFHDARPHLMDRRNERFKPWVDVFEAELTDASGDHDLAHAALSKVRVQGPKALDYSVAAYAEDRFLRVNLNLGELEAAAEAWARATLLRKKNGAVASVYERVWSRPAKNTLKERLGEANLRVVFRRVEEASLTEPETRSA